MYIAVVAVITAWIVDTDLQFHSARFCRSFFANISRYLVENAVSTSGTAKVYANTWKTRPAMAHCALSTVSKIFKSL